MKLPDVQLLDGDVVRAGYTKKLGFSRKDRIANIKKMGMAADKTAKKGGIAICAAVAPHSEAREANRRRIGRHAKYIEIFVDTPLKICEKRDVKGLYKKARAGLIKHFTGIDDPYEPPKKPDIKISTQKSTPIESANIILTDLSAREIL
jgi:sulfate adenylyltransferase